MVQVELKDLEYATRKQITDFALFNWLNKITKKLSSDNFMPFIDYGDAIPSEFVNAVKWDTVGL